MNEMILAKYRDLIQTKNFKISNVIINPNTAQCTAVGKIGEVGPYVNLDFCL